MRPTFILTRTFAISALFVGAAPLAYAAPITETRVPSVVASGVVVVGDVLAHDVPVEVRAPIDLVTVNRVDETALEAHPQPEPEPESVEARNCNGYMGCRRELATPEEPELENRNCNGYMGCRRKREQPARLEERNCNGWMGCRRERVEEAQIEDRNCNGSPNCKAAREESPQPVQQR